ncbi:hypothetical protein FOA52_010822 [Chlamydomonas sp. UWO 241]|nr:hypothetical protein FOA52_010822 [Chlamydomonas sp. UWO 241]
MGCGSSMAGSASGFGKDAEDFTMEPIFFKSMKVPVFDDFLIGKVALALNKVVDMVNEVNGSVDNIKDAVAVLQGAFKVHVDTAKERDAVILSLQKALPKEAEINMFDDDAMEREIMQKLDRDVLLEGGLWPTAAEVGALETFDASMPAADKKLTKARKALEAATEATYAKLFVIDDWEDKQGGALSSAAPTPALAGFTTALTAMRTAVAPNYKVIMVVKNAGAGGADSVPVFSSPDAKPTWEAAGVLAMAKAKSAKELFAAQQSVAIAIALLGEPIKTAREAGVKVVFSVQGGRKVAATMTGGEEKKTPSTDAVQKKADAKAFEKAERAKDSVRVATTNVNQQLFKLIKYGRNTAGEVTLAKSLVILVEALKKKVMELAKGKDAAALIKFVPKLEFGIEGVDFDLGLSVSLDGYKGLSTKDTINKLLPGPGKLVYASIEEMVANVKNKMIPAFKKLSEQIEDLVRSVEQVFGNPAEKIKEAFGPDTGGFAVSAAAATATKHAKTVTVEPVKYLNTFKWTLVRIKAEFEAAFTEIKEVLE